MQETEVLSDQAYYMQDSNAQQPNNIGSNRYQTSLTLRGRAFSSDDLEVIQQCVKENFHKGRTRISQAICEKLDWRQPNGWLKDRACRDVLLSLEKKGLIDLPPRQVNNVPILVDQKKHPSYLRQYDLLSPILNFPPNIRIEFAKGNNMEKIWNELVRLYHYLGHDVLVGRCIKYLVKSEDRLLGALAFSSPAWRLAPRDIVLRHLGLDIDKVGDYVVNNSRFLLLPYVKVKNLASAVLSLATDQIVTDWTKFYSITPQIAETFVQPSRFLGTCYRAANWIEVGSTRGYAKSGYTHHNSQEPKLIFLYGLNKNIRKRLLKVAGSQV